MLFGCCCFQGLGLFFLRFEISGLGYNRAVGLRAKGFRTFGLGCLGSGMDAQVCGARVPPSTVGLPVILHSDNNHSSTLG